MALVAPLADAQASEAAKGIFQNLQSKMGKVLNIFRTLGHAPEILQATLAFNQGIQKDLDPKLRELAYLKTTQVNQCNYRMHYHKGLGQKAGLSDAQIHDLDKFEQSTAYNDLEKLVLRFADQWTRQGKASPEVVKQLTQKLSPAQMIVLAGSVGLANWTNRFNETFAVELP